MLVTIAMLMGLSASPIIMAAAGGEVDVELALAVDVSRSMDYEEVQIQRQGYVEALSHPEFITAVKGGMLGRIAISYYEWAGEVDQASVIDWQIIETAEDAKAFAEKLAARPVATQRRTSISAAISYGATSIISNNYRGMRQVIDVSGDGPNNIGVPVLPVRDRAIESGIVINGLAIMLRPSGTAGGLDRYYSDCVAGGPGSFVLPVHKIEDFAIAIRRKMVMEVSNILPSPKLHRIANELKADCLSGERQWQDFLDR
ncbi:DUF1194 domain-containing protein [Rhizobiales bacterium RZME27]|jgi:hypothetical protein|uniref:DUF1194 domain-containing protein n=1 Tax=Endobacterium cereale TaxID=2663029 RepID=A0A6A8A859_9HYPH|nr:DUF1194 domain-containing protein [Endobacterium cereale]MEB2844343.1 DUF1194 domain-containing protein [Endobacterium cereale]MQY46934.1 DUF1194 domain-containing protein [Endobacterium cereale]